MAIPAEIQEYLKGPSCPPPEGETSNLDNHSTSNGGPFFVAVLCIVLVTMSTLARAYSRIFIIKQLHIEDYIGMFAVIPFAGVAWCFFDYGLKGGFFVQQWNLPGAFLVDLGYIGFVIAITYSLVMLLLKTAILLEWIRIFVPHRIRNVFYWSSVILILLNAGVYISAITSNFGACRPLKKLWHFWVPGACFDRKTRDVINATFNLVMDIFILALPQKIIWTLHTSVRRKVGVSIIFSVGLLVVAIAAGRLYATITLDYPNDLTKPINMSYKFSQTLLWAVSEITCIFLVFCVPALPKLFSDQGIVSRIMASWRSWTRLPQPYSSKKPSKVSWPRNSESVPGSQHRTQHYPEGDTTNYSGTELNLVQVPVVESPANGDQHPSSPPQIFKTVEFNSREDAASKTSADPCVELQHPWMAHNA